MSKKFRVLAVERYSDQEIGDHEQVYRVHRTSLGKDVTWHILVGPIIPDVTYSTTEETPDVPDSP